MNMNIVNAPPGSFVDSRCESEMRIAEEQRVKACSLARNTLGG